VIVPKVARRLLPSGVTAVTVEDSVFVPSVTVIASSTAMPVISFTAKRMDPATTGADVVVTTSAVGDTVGAAVGVAVGTFVELDSAPEPSTPEPKPEATPMTEPLPLKEPL